MNYIFKKCFIAVSVLSLFVLSIIPGNDLLSAPINSNVALPVRKGGFIFRSQARWLRATDDPTSSDKQVNVVAIPNALVYGVTPDLALFAIFPYIFRNVELTDPSSGKRIDKNDSGIGDLTLIGRYTIYAKDYPSGTARFAPLAGIKLPTGDDDLEPITTESVDLQFGGVSTITWDFGRHEIDADMIYRVNTEAKDFEKGNDLIYDLAYEFRVLPWTLPDVGAPNFLYLVAEANGIFSQKSELNGKTIDNSGGSILFLSPGIQFATKRYILEASIQLPVIQDLNGNQVETDFVFTAGFRVNLP
jgi:hypothetical protein